ncbi:DUF2326 domain-containing protein [Chryseobacterium sp. G0186]|uniref:DUF2326 domain-containing protein n=1 Tax=Chryseobacterium sp. G0186 TaxID=2487064 RepID=UPI000F5046D3|nr:DUF2326 domain-containing protein [Chryseobacterium sp. G0186]AZA78711.1 DUF2326 domain-containing protein [Chryseobacterium sp. G0186]
MRLISVKANQQSFRPVEFKNRNGLNLIVAQQSEGQNSNENSFNGVGKSLLMAIIQFCLGSSTKKSFKKNLPGWEFFLEFEIDDKIYISSRTTLNQTSIKLNDESLKIKDFTNKLQELLFDIPQDQKSLSFRALLPFFYRPRRGSFLNYKNPNTLKSDYQILLTNTFLLGIDTLLVKEKYDLKSDKDRIKELLSQLNSDPLLKDFFIGERDSSLSIQDLSDKIDSLEIDLKKFSIAEDYYDIKKSADNIRRSTVKLQNEISLLENQKLNIQKSLESSPDISKEKIIKIYEESKISFSNELKKTLDELDNFYIQITKNRIKRLSNQKQDLIREIENKDSELKKLHIEFDKNLQYLNTHQALDVFINLTNKLSDLKSEKNQIENYQKLLKEYHSAKLDIDKKFIEATANTENYLNDVNDFIKGISDFFRALAKSFYPKALAGLSINNNEGENSIRFNLEARIESDSSDGISNVKIFCYDLTILLLGQNHNMNSIFHDSRILDGIDPRQISILFKVANQYITENNKQYIITMNQNHLDELAGQMSKEEYENIIEANICHIIGDDDPKNKLLGIQIDMEYEA